MFEPISQNLSLRDRIVQDILQKLETGELAAGDRLPPERDLAASYNVSRTTVRDALRTLAGLGILSILHGKGMFVQANEGIALGNALWAPFIVKPDTVSALFEVRKTLETEAAGWAASRGQVGQKQNLLDIVKAAKESSHVDGQVDPDVAATSDQAFHTSLFLASGNPIAGRLMVNLLDVLEEVRKRSLAIPGRAWLSILDHERIAKAVADGDSEAAREAMLKHLTAVEVAVLSSLNG